MPGAAQPLLGRVLSGQIGPHDALDDVDHLVGAAVVIREITAPHAVGELTLYAKCIHFWTMASLTQP